MTQQAPALDPIESSNMTLMEHLQELRVRLMWIAGGLIGGTLLSMLFVTQIIQFIILPLGGERPQAIGPTDTIGIFFKVSFAVGAAIAMPMPLPTPWPSGPVVVSTPGVCPYSGWPGVRLPHWRNCFRSSSVTSNPAR